MDGDLKLLADEPVLDSLYTFDSLESTAGQDEEIQIPRRVLDDFIRQMEQQRNTLLNLRIQMDNGIINMLNRKNVSRSKAKVQQDADSRLTNTQNPHKLLKTMDNNYTKDTQGFNSTANHHTENKCTLNFTENDHTKNEQWYNDNDCTNSTYAVVKDDILRNIAMIENEILNIENDELEIDRLMEKDHPENDILIIEKNSIEKDKPILEKDNLKKDNLITEVDNPENGIPIIIITEAEEETYNDEDATAVSPNDNDEDVPFSKSKKRRLRKKRKIQEIKLKKLEKLAKRATLELTAEDAAKAVKTAETDGSVTDKKQKKDALVEEEENDVVIVEENIKHALAVGMETGDKICLEKIEDEVIVEEKEMSAVEGGATIKKISNGLIAGQGAAGRSVVRKEAKAGLFIEKTERHVAKDEIENQLNFLREAIEEMANAEKKNKHEISPEVMVATAVFNYMMKKAGEKFITPAMERVQDIIFISEYFNIYMMILLYSILFYKLLFSLFCAC